MRAVDYALRNGAHILSASFGRAYPTAFRPFGPPPPWDGHAVQAAAYARALAPLQGAGVLLFAAAGGPILRDRRNRSHCMPTFQPDIRRKPCFACAALPPSPTYAASYARIRSRVHGSTPRAATSVPGNDGVDLDMLSRLGYSNSPCLAGLVNPNVICVGAAGPDDVRAPFSNYGREAVAVAAPGTICSTWPGACQLGALPVGVAAPGLVNAHVSCLKSTKQHPC